MTGVIPWVRPLVLAAALLAISGAHAAPLDGRTFTGTITRQGESQGDPDDFIFKDGKFISSACAGFGFRPATYAFTDDGDRLQFRAVSEADGGVQMQWQGTIVGDRLEATAHWIRPGQPVMEFRGDATLRH